MHTFEVFKINDEGSVIKDGAPLSKGDIISSDDTIEFKSESIVYIRSKNTGKYRRVVGNPGDQGKLNEFIFRLKKLYRSAEESNQYISLFGHPEEEKIRAEVLEMLRSPKDEGMTPTEAAWYFVIDFYGNIKAEDFVDWVETQLNKED